MSDEIEYRYVKGKGWIPDTNPNNIYRIRYMVRGAPNISERAWINYSTYKSLEDAEAHAVTLRRRYPNYEFVIRYEDGSNDG